MREFRINSPEGTGLGWTSVPLHHHTESERKKRGNFTHLKVQKGPQATVYFHIKRICYLQMCLEVNINFLQSKKYYMYNLGVLSLLLKMYHLSFSDSNWITQCKMGLLLFKSVKVKGRGEEREKHSWQILYFTLAIWGTLGSWLMPAKEILSWTVLILDLQQKRKRNSVRVLTELFQGDFFLTFDVWGNTQFMWN